MTSEHCVYKYYRCGLQRDNEFSLGSLDSLFPKSTGNLFSGLNATVVFSFLYKDNVDCGGLYGKDVIGEESALFIYLLI